LSAKRADARQTERQFVQVHLSEKNGASTAQLRNLEGVPRRHDSTQRQ
jgi:hypothetical protein